VGCAVQAVVGQNQPLGKIESAGPPTAQHLFWPFQPFKNQEADVMLTSAALFLKIPFPLCLKIPENVCDL
jgi:hypothetical protein